MRIVIVVGAFCVSELQVRKASYALTKDIVVFRQSTAGSRVDYILYFFSDVVEGVIRNESPERSHALVIY